MNLRHYRRIIGVPKAVAEISRDPLVETVLSNSFLSDVGLWTPTLKMINAAIPPIFTCLSPRNLLDMETLLSGSLANDVTGCESSSRSLAL